MPCEAALARTLRVRLMACGTPCSVPHPPLVSLLRRASSSPPWFECAPLPPPPPRVQARSQEARSNWEAALDSKDRAISQLEDALAARQRTIEQLNRQAAAGGAGSAALEASLADAQVCSRAHGRSSRTAWCY